MPIELAARLDERNALRARRQRLEHQLLHELVDNYRPHLDPKVLSQVIDELLCWMWR